MPFLYKLDRNQWIIVSTITFPDGSWDAVESTIMTYRMALRTLRETLCV